MMNLHTVKPALATTRTDRLPTRNFPCRSVLSDLHRATNYLTRLASYQFAYLRTLKKFPTVTAKLSSGEIIKQLFTLASCTKIDLN